LEINAGSAKKENWVEVGKFFKSDTQARRSKRNEIDIILSF
jgi:hypothetical protein